MCIRSNLRRIALRKTPKKRCVRPARGLAEWFFSRNSFLARYCGNQATTRALPRLANTCLTTDDNQYHSESGHVAVELHVSLHVSLIQCYYGVLS